MPDGGGGRGRPSGPADEPESRAPSAAPDAAAEEPPEILRRRRVALAGHRGDAAGVRRYLSDADPAMRATALRALDCAGSLPAADLERLIGDGHPAVRSAALELAAGRGDVPRAAAAARLADRDPRVVEAAAWACGEMAGRSAATSEETTKGEARARAERVAADSEAALAALAWVATSHDDPLCRESAVAALGAIGDPAGLQAIFAGLGDKPAVRRRAVIALASFDGPEADAALRRARLDRDRQVRSAASELERLRAG